MAVRTKNRRKSRKVARKSRKAVRKSRKKSRKTVRKSMKVVRKSRRKSRKTVRKSRKSKRKSKRKSRRKSRKSRRKSRKSRKVVRKSRKVARKSRRKSRKSRKVARKSRKVARKSRKVARKSKRNNKRYNQMMKYRMKQPNILHTTQWTKLKKDQKDRAKERLRNYIVYESDLTSGENQNDFRRILEIYPDLINDVSISISEEETPLIQAILEKNETALKILMEHNSDPNAKFVYTDQTFSPQTMDLCELAKDPEYGWDIAEEYLGCDKSPLKYIKPSHDY